MIAPSLFQPAAENSGAFFAKLVALIHFLMRFGSTASLS